MAELAGKWPLPSWMSSDCHSFRRSNLLGYSAEPVFCVFLSMKLMVRAPLIIPRHFRSGHISGSVGSARLLDGRRTRGVGSGSQTAGSSWCSFEPMGQTLGHMTHLDEPWVWRTWTPSKFMLWALGTNQSSTPVSSMLYNAAIASMSVGQSSGLQSHIVDRADQKRSISIWRHWRVRTVATDDALRVVMTSQHSRSWLRSLTSSTVIQSGQPIVSLLNAVCDKVIRRYSTVSNTW